MNNVNQTLYIPLYGKAYVSRRGIILEDKTAEKIIYAESPTLGRRSRSKWLAYYMGIRSAVFDLWLAAKMCEMPDAAVIHVGCGLDSRVHRIGASECPWYDVDFPDVIEERRKYYSESEGYKMISADIREREWLDGIAESDAIVVMEGVSMYLSREELCEFMSMLSERFDSVALLCDCYSELAARMSKYKNPVNEVGVNRVYGLDDPRAIECCGITFVREWDMTPEEYIDELSGMEKRIFKKLYAGSFARKLYKLYEYSKSNENKEQKQ